MKNLEEMPDINWPNKSGEFKFVQLEVQDKLFLRFQSQHQDYHSEILRDFLRDLNLPIIRIKSKLGRMVPQLQIEGRYIASGMGIAEVYLEEKRIDFLGKSRDYGIGVNKEHLDRIGLVFPDWKFRYL